MQWVFGSVAGHIIDGPFPEPDPDDNILVNALLVGGQVMAIQALYSNYMMYRSNTAGPTSETFAFAMTLGVLHAMPKFQARAAHFGNQVADRVTEGVASFVGAFAVDVEGAGETTDQ